jgi:TrmH family RNA methyltransferase
MSALAHELRAARRDPSLAVLEGFHAVKHAVRFGARFERLLCADRATLGSLASSLAPDVADAVLALAEEVGPEPLASLTMVPEHARIVGLVRRPEVDVRALLAAPDPAPIVLLEAPRRLGNVGACVRVAAAAGAAGVLTTGAADPWHPDALRGAAGLHFALPVARVADGVDLGGRPLVGLALGGARLSAAVLPPRAVLAFGTERDGLTDALLARADARVEIPMREGVSSLNLATAVAVTLYARGGT